MEAGKQEAAIEETDRAEMAGEEGRMGPKAALLAIDVRCPLCHAEPGEGCRKRNRPTVAHDAREIAANRARRS